MFVNEDIKNGFLGMIGVRQSPNGYPEIDSDLTNSDYGYYLQDIHPFFTHENFYNCIKGLKDASTESYSDYFRRRFEFAYITSVRAVVQRKLSANASGHTVINNLLLYDGRGTTEMIAKRNRFVGIKIMLTKANLKFVLNNIAIQLSEAQTLNLYVYKANNQDAVFTIPVTYNTPFSMYQRSVLDVITKNDLSSNEYIIGYYESDLVGSAIRRDVDFISMKANCCNNATYSYWQKYNKFVTVRTFYVEETYLSDDRTLSWMNTHEMITNNTNYGLNLQFSVECDITDLVIQQKNLFVELVKQTLSNQLLKDLIYTQENNSVSNFLRGFIGRESLVDFMKPEEDKLKKAIEETALDVSSLNSTCFPNSFKSRKVKTGSL